MSNISLVHLQDKIMGPGKFSTYKEPETENGRFDGYYMLIMRYA